VDGRSDLYSLALVYFRMLTGELPFQADSVQEMMVKRLTDDPAKLAATRPDLTFPDGLQQILDAALARTPAERYQTVAKFADDVVAVAGLARGTRGVAPATRADIEGKTQLLDSHETKAQAAKRAPARKQRSLVPIIVGAVVVLGLGGGGYVLLVGRGGAAVTPPDTTRQQTATVPVDTGKTIAVSNPTGTTKTTQQHASNSGTSGGLGRDSVKPTPLSHSGGSGIDVSNAFDLLDDMMMNKLNATTATWIRDSALRFFNAPGINGKDKAYAAFIVGNAFFQLKDRSQGCQWARKAVQLDPSSSAYTRFIGQCQE